MNPSEPTAEELASRARKSRMMALLFALLSGAALVLGFIDYHRGNLALVAMQVLLAAVWAWLAWSYWRRASR